MLYGPDACFKEAVREWETSFELQEDVAVYNHSIGPFHILCGKTSKAGFERYALGSNFQFCNSGAGLQGARGEIFVIPSDEDVSGRSHEEASKYQI